MHSKLKTRLLALLRKSEMERELDDELRYHIEQQAEQNIRLGMNPEEARRAARKAFGGVEQAKERSRDARGVRWIEELLQDLRYGARMLRKNPGFTAVAALTLALGIGANTAIFSVVNAVLLRPYPYKDQDRLMWLWETNLPEIPRLSPSPANFLDWQKQNTVFEQLEACNVMNFNLVGGANSARIRGMVITHGFLSMLGIRPRIGRDFLPDEDRAGRNNVVILSHDLWQRQFGGDPNILNQSIKLDDQPFTVIGVMPPNRGFRFQDDHLWTPIAFTAEQIQNRRGGILNVFGRLKPEATLEQARSEMSAIAGRLANQYPDTNTGWNVTVDPMVEEAVSQIRPSLLLLLGAVTFVLLIACANVANLLLARAAVRRKEIAVRTALGASRWRIVRQLLTESLLLSLAGAIIGLTLASWGLKIMIAMADNIWPRIMDFSLDVRILVFTSAITLLTGLSFGLVPALQTSKPNLNEMLKDAGRGSTEGGSRQVARNALVVIEVAISLVLLVGAGLLIRSFIGLQRVDPGFDPKNALTVSISLTERNYPEKDRQAAFYSRLIERVSALPGVQVTGAATAAPFSDAHWGGHMGRGLRIEGRTGDQAGNQGGASYYSVSPNYFRAMDIPLLRGRLFTEFDTKDAPRVAIINSTMANRYFPNEDPIGKRIQLTSMFNNGPEFYREIVGIVGDVKSHSLYQETYPQTYEPHTQEPFPFMTLVVRAAGDPTGLSESIRREVLQLDKEQPVFRIETLDQLIAISTGPRRFSMMLFGVFAAAAIALASIGLYGVMSYAVTQHTQEIGIRMALGARRPDVLWLILRHGARLTLCGVAVGILAAWAMTRLLINLLYGVSATDPLTFIGVSLLLIGVALLACYIPARRATKVDAMVALRCD
ncbi:MAG TPA: ABC transporter permease [Blastocatellia bacterium]|nr:ABC transporter permease [Blastocatellia bacterium]